MGMQIRGLVETQQALIAIPLKLNAIKVKVLDRFARRVSEIAKRVTPVDTGALQESIFHGILKSTIDEVIAEVVAGSETVIRGEGRFAMSKKTGLNVSKRSTVEYAEDVEAQAKFMETAFQWANKNIDRELRRAINEVLRGF